MSESGVSLTWLGQAGFFLEGDGVRILVDPWFSPHEHRTADPPRVASLPDGVGWLLATHEHGDHLDLSSLPEVVARFPAIRIVVPTPLVDATREAAGEADVVGIRPGDVVEAGAVRVTATPAWHGLTVDDGYTDGGWQATGATRFVGYVLAFSGLTLYHGGDTVADERLLRFLEPLGVDVALLPVNGRDFFREAEGILGNLDAAEAVEVARRLGARVLVPMHHDMVAGNTARPGAVADVAAGRGVPLHVLIPARGRSINLALPPREAA